MTVLQISVVLHPYIVTKLIPFSLVQSYIPYNMVLQTRNVLPSYMLMTLSSFNFFWSFQMFPDISIWYRMIHPIIQYTQIWVTYNDLTVTSLEWWGTIVGLVSGWWQLPQICMIHSIDPDAIRCITTKGEDQHLRCQHHCHASLGRRSRENPGSVVGISRRKHGGMMGF